VVISTPNKPIPMEATPIARRYGAPPEAGINAVRRPKTRMAKPTMASEIHAVSDRALLSR
jgi:hypothetical protein